VIGDESEVGDCDEMIHTQDKVNREETEQNEVDGMKKEADSTGKVMHYVKERVVICNEEDTNGRARVTRDEERVLPVD